MNVVVAYESMYGNTRQIAEAIADALKPLGKVEVASVNAGEGDAADDADVLIVGGPTHMHGLATSMSRKGVGAGAKEEGIDLEPGAADGPGLRKWLSERDGKDRKAAAFDTRIDKPPVLTGTAARGIAKRLRHRGYDVVADAESFFVDDTEGPLAEGELERAKAWGASLAEKLG
ncbi:MAG: flavodoxin domain-containing protein [Solirubrobacterales bacterium]